MKKKNYIWYKSINLYFYLSTFNILYLKNPSEVGKVKIITRKLKQPSMVLCLCKTFAGKFIAGSFLKLIHDIILFSGPVLLYKYCGITY
jgi:hypothetical protein